jgi:hypothetical protein
MAELPDHEMDDWPCPGLSAHPSGRIAAPTVSIDWTAEDWLEEQAARQRVVDYTCSCCVVVYELLSGGGTCVFRRTHQTTPPRAAYTGPWQRAKAHPG